jgi:4-amino-4-deoxy-L-arabinose transferase-like glycosyltransferase
VKKTRVNVALALLLVSLVIIKLALGFYWRDSFFMRGNNCDIINPVAVSMINGQGFGSAGNATIEHEFLYPVLVAGCYWVFGINWVGITLLQAILSALTGLIIYLLCLRLFNDHYIALGAFLLVLFHPYLFIHALSISDTTLFTFLVALLFFQMYVVYRNPSALNSFLLGSVLAASILTRDSAVVFLIPVGICLMWVLGKRHIRELVLILLTIMVFVAPWLVRNYLLTNKILLSSHGYEVLWQGNNDYSWDYIVNDISVDMIPRPKTITEIQSRSSERTIETVLAERSAYLDEIKRFVMENPMTVVSLAGLKFVKFWTWIYNPKPEKVTYLSVNLRSIFYTCYFLPFLMFGVIGFVISYHIRKPYVVFCLMMILSFTIVHMISVGFTRLRLPLDPILSVFASASFFIVCYRIAGKEL